MHRRSIQWLAIGLPAALVGLFEFTRHKWLDHTLPGPWGNIVGALLVAAAVYGFIRYFTAAVTRTEQELGRSRAEAAVLAERQRIGRDMHDSVAQTLFHVRVRLHDLSGDSGVLQPELVRLTSLVGSAYDQVRAVIADLKRAPEAEDTAEAVRRAASAAGHELGLEVRLNVSGLPTFPGGVRQHLESIVTEALTNARRHGGATSVEISADSLGLTIRDNGAGFAVGAESDKGFGLVIMAERTRMVGAHLEIQSDPGRGTTLRLIWEVSSHAGADSDRR